MFNINELQGINYCQKHLDSSYITVCVQLRYISSSVPLTISNTVTAFIFFIFKINYDGTEQTGIFRTHNLYVNKC
jgi:hypothetical protein